jgi:hypothetical protein
MVIELVYILPYLRNPFAAYPCQSQEDTRISPGKGRKKTTARAFSAIAVGLKVLFL